MRRIFLFSSALLPLLLASIQTFAADPWYAAIVTRFRDAGYQTVALDPARGATRSSFVDLIVKLKGGVVHGPFATPTFDDIPETHPRFFVFEEAARNGWVKGLHDCAGTHPCLAAPERVINRAEAATILLRAFSLTPGAATPTFIDLPADAWYAQGLLTAASRCIFRGDDAGKTVRPSDTLNQVEMLAVLERSLQQLQYPSCQSDATVALPKAPETLRMELPIATPSTETDAASPPTTSATQTTTSSARSSVPSNGAQTTGTASAGAASLASLPSLTLPTSGVAAPPTVSSDPSYASFVSKYNEYVASFIGLLDQTKLASWETTLQLLTILRSQMDSLAIYYRYVTLARDRILTASERQIVSATMATIEAGFLSANGVAK